MSFTRTLSGALQIHLFRFEDGEGAAFVFYGESKIPVVGSLTKAEIEVFCAQADTLNIPYAFMPKSVEIPNTNKRVQAVFPAAFFSRETMAKDEMQKLVKTYNQFAKLTT